MDHYVDIRLLPDPEFPATTLMNALFSKLHRGLVSFGAGDIGISFPDSRANIKGLGERLRLHGNLSPLRTFLESDWLRGMRDHVSLQGPGPVPADVCYRIVRRVQARSNPERERRRLIARTGISPESALARIPDSSAELLDLPFVLLNSSSTGQHFRLFIDQGEVLDRPQPGEFSAYGLSSTGTIPWF